MTAALAALVRQHRARFDAYTRACEYLSVEAIAGDVLEFGTFAGASLALLTHALEATGPAPRRRAAGYDSFQGLPPAADPHRRWTTGSFAVNEWWHPTLPIGAPVTADVPIDLCRACGLALPAIHAGRFEDTLPVTIPSTYGSVALVHVDCDLYEPARFVLERVEPVLQNGAVVLFDDWYLYGANPARGEARALREFLDAHPAWGAADFGPYGPFSRAFILYRH